MTRPNTFYSVQVDLATGKITTIDCPLAIAGQKPYRLSTLELRAFASGADIVQLRPGCSYKRLEDIASIKEGNAVRTLNYYDSKRITV